MKKWNWRVLLAASSLTFAAAASSAAHGGGIEVPMQGAAGAAQADAFTAQADDPSAIFYNPAGLTQLDGTNLSVGAYYIQPDIHFEGDPGVGDGRTTLPSVLPHVYAETDLGTKNGRFGFGVNDVFGLNEDYGDRGPLRFLANEVHLSVIDFAPTVAYKVNDHLSVGLAANIYYGDLTLTHNVPLGPPPFPEGHFRLHGDDYSFGVTPSIMWKIDDRNQVGAYYRSPFTMNFDGHAKVTIPGAPGFGPSSTRESLNFPQSVGVGYAVRPIKPLKVEADVIWTDWHTVDQLRVKSPSPLFNGNTFQADWRSGFTYRLGAQYNLSPHWVVRGGYAYGQDAVPESTFSPIVPDSQYHLFAAGIGYVAPHWNLDLAYNYILREGREIGGSVNSPAVNGNWDNRIQGLMLTFTWKI